MSFTEVELLTSIMSHASSSAGLRISTLYDHYQRLRKRGLLVDVTMHVPDGPTLVHRQ